jgi:N-acetylneuraminate synthase
VEGIRFIERMKSRPVEKDLLAERLGGVRQIFSKSIAAVCDLAPGMVVCAEHLALKKPGSGLPAQRLSDLVGRKLARPVAANQLLADEDFSLDATAARMG